MDPKEVLKKFLDVCTNKDDKCTRHSFASNGVLEWFGRNIKDNNKIFEYIRYNLSHQYEHIFSVAIRCEAFEEKPLHKATRLQLPDTITNAVESKSVDIFETPPSRSASKEATDDMATPERKTRLAGRNEHSESDEEKSFQTSPRITRSSRKRSSHESHSNSPSKRNKSNVQKETDHQLNRSAETTQQPSDPPKNNDGRSSHHPAEVSEMKYIEAIGTIRKLRKLKHRGIDSRSKDIRIYESPTRQHWDAGNTKLKISYRENVNHSDLQFVLVIYQHIENNPRCKRDLMAEFTKTCSDESQSEPQKSSEKKGKTNNNKNLKMRRLRF